MKLFSLCISLLIYLVLSTQDLRARQVTEIEPNDKLGDIGTIACLDTWPSIAGAGGITGTISPQDTDYWCSWAPFIYLFAGYPPTVSVSCDQEMAWSNETIHYTDYPWSCEDFSNPVSIQPESGGGSSSNFADWTVTTGYFCFAISSTTHVGEYSCTVVSEHLPVELIYFNALGSDKEINLTWTTLSETNNIGFEIQTNIANSWTTLGFVDGMGTTTERHDYSYTLRDFDYGLHQFRLKQKDYDGTFSLSDVVELSLQPGEDFYISELFPNPFSETSSLQLFVPQSQRLRVRLFNYLGQDVQVLFEGTVEANRSLRIEIDPKQSIPNGKYLVHVEGESFDETKLVTLIR